MKEEYDFSDAEQGKFYVAVDDIQLPIYLDMDIIQYLNEKCLTSQQVASSPYEVQRNTGIGSHEIPYYASSIRATCYRIPGSEIGFRYHAK
jgi:hypothetical protein